MLICPEPICREDPGTGCSLFTGMFVQQVGCYIWYIWCGHAVSTGLDLKGKESWSSSPNRFCLEQQAIWQYQTWTIIFLCKTGSFRKFCNLLIMVGLFSWVYQGPVSRHRTHSSLVKVHGRSGDGHGGVSGVFCSCRDRIVFFPTHITFFINIENHLLFYDQLLTVAKTICNFSCSAWIL